jgi:ribosomal protein S18 acetylase RimI-like enzyme
MTEPAKPYRRAASSDAEPLADLVNFAGEGLPLYLWTELATSEQSAWDIGRNRAQRDTGSFSWRNAVVREDDGEISACLIGYALPATPQPFDRNETPAMFVPLIELENLAAGTWYINVVATYPESRGKGYGSELLAIAERLARESGSTGLSLVVADSNCGAIRLYERRGYTAVATRPMVKEGWDGPGENWVLMTRPF